MAVEPGMLRLQRLRQTVRHVLERRLIHFLLITSVMTLVALLLHLPRWGATEYFDNLALDQYFLLRGEHNPETVAKDLPHTKDIVLIETGHQIPRPLMAQLLDRLSQAKVVAIDMMFVDSEGELEPEEKPLYQAAITTWRRDTDILARKIKEVGNVVVGAWPEQVRDPEPRLIWQRPEVALWRNARYRAHFLVEPDPWDLKVRQVALFKTVVFEIRQGRQWRASPPERVPGLGLAIAAAAADMTPQQLQNLEVRNGVLRFGQRTIPVDTNGVMLIDYAGTRRSFESMENHLNYMQVLGSDFYEPGDFRDKIVIIGESSFKSKEILDTPYGEMPGMQIHAHVVATLLSAQGPPRPLPLWQTAGIALLCSLWLVLPLLRLPLWGSFLFAGLQVVLLIFFGAWIFAAFHRVLPVSVPAIAIALTYNAIALYEYRRARDTLGKFIGPEMVTQTMHIFSRPKLGGETGEATAFFCDLRGFSNLPSIMSPQAVNRLVNSYTDALVKVVRKHGGRPIDFQGDGVFVLFEPARAGTEYSVNAIRAALEMQHVFARLRDAWVAEGAPLMEIGIGIDTGTLVIGAVGGEDHLKMGAVGAAVNTAARVQGLSRQCGYTVLITHNTYEQVRDAVAANHCGTFVVRGREEPIDVYGVEHLLTSETEPSAPTRTRAPVHSTSKVAFR